MESVKHQIEYKRLDEIRPYDNNPRRNDEAAKAFPRPRGGDP